MMDQREATLDELLSEPIILEMMACDRVRASDIRRLMRQARSRERIPNRPVKWDEGIATGSD